MNMTDSETYQGSANRETWAFLLHINNDRSLYEQTLDYAKGQDPSDLSDRLLGGMVVNFWREYIDAMTDDVVSTPLELRMLEREVGSWWRINHAEVGAAVRESLENESTD